MIIELKHKITGRQIIIETNVDDAGSPTSIKITSLKMDGQHQEALQHELGQSYGHYGHMLDIEQTNNLDLAAAVRKLPSFDVVSIDPEPTASDLPEGAVS
jgi:hypothetical protein